MSSARTPGRILIVDDNDEAADLLQMLLNLEGYDTATANSGKDGLHSAETFRPHVICSDIGMPEMSGVEFGRKLRQSTHSSNALLIAITGWNDIDNATEITRAGFDLHLAKPVSFDEVSRHIRTFFERHPALLSGG
jgi:DNA-binding response OmpR family regulator